MSLYYWYQILNYRSRKPTTREFNLMYAQIGKQASETIINKTEERQTKKLRRWELGRKPSYNPPSLQFLGHRQNTTRFFIEKYNVNDL